MSQRLSNPFGPPALASQAPPAIILAVLRRFRGPALFRGLRHCSSPGAPFWPSGLTVRRSRPPTAAAELRALELINMKKRKIFAFLFLAFAMTTGYAQVYKCIVNGRTIFSDAPCQAGSTGVLIQEKKDPEQIYQERLQALEAENRKLQQQALRREQQLNEQLTRPQPVQGQSAPPGVRYDVTVSEQTRRCDMEKNTITNKKRREGAECLKLRSMLNMPEPTRVIINNQNTPSHPRTVINNQTGKPCTVFPGGHMECH